MSDSETTDSVPEKPATPTRRKRTTASKSKEGAPSTQTRRRRTSTEDLSDAVPSSSRRRRSSAADENASADSAPTRSTRRAASEDADQSAPNKVDEGTSPSQPAQQHRRRTRRIETGTDALAAHESATPASERQDSSSTGERRPKGRVKRHQSQNRFERAIIVVITVRVMQLVPVLILLVPTAMVIANKVMGMDRTVGSSVITAPIMRLLLPSFR